MEPYVELEQELAKWVGPTHPHVVVCSTGTAALHLAFEALELPAGSEVVVPDFTFVACARAVSLAGLKPTFVGCDNQLLIDPSKVGDAVGDAYDGIGNCEWKPGRLVSAVMPVNVYGREYDVFGVRKVTESYGIKVVEDLAEAHGVKPSYNADAACWSFYRNKIVHGEEGGAVAFRDKASADYARALRSQGFTGEPWFHLRGAMNYRMTNAQATLIRQSLWGFDAEVAHRRKLEEAYNTYCPAEWKMPSRDAPWMYDLRVPSAGFDRLATAVRELQAAGVGARHGFRPLHLQPEYRDRPVFGSGEAGRAFHEVLALPLDASVSAETPRRAFDVLRRVLG